MICNFFPNFFLKYKKLHLSSLFVCSVRSYLKSLLWTGKKKYLFTHLLYVEFWCLDKKKYLSHFFIYISWPTVSRIWTSLTLWLWWLGFRLESIFAAAPAVSKNTSCCKCDHKWLENYHFTWLTLSIMHSVTLMRHITF